jgi:hypothetical protein
MTTSRTDAMFKPMSPQKQQMKQSWRQRTGGGFLFGDDPNGGGDAAAAATSSTSDVADITATLRRYEERCVQLGIEPRAEIWAALSALATPSKAAHVTVGEVPLSVSKAIFFSFDSYAFL